MNVGELKEKLGMNSRTSIYKCSCCGKEIIVPNMYKEKDIRSIKPFCMASTYLTFQWMIHHGWHISRENRGNFYCPDCFPEGTPEMEEHPAAKEWCEANGVEFTYYKPHPGASRLKSG